MIEMVIFGAALLAFLVVALVFMHRQRKKNAKTKGQKDSTDKKDKKTDEPITKSVKELIPLEYYDEKLGCYMMNGKLVDIIRIQSKDLVNMSDSDLQYDIMRLSKWYKTYADDIKIVSLNFPADTREQQEYLKKKIGETNNPQRKHWIERKLNEEQWLANNKTVREYYIIFYSENEEEYRKNRNRILSALQTGVTGLAEEIGKDQKDRIWQTLCNKYSVLH